eukprot:gene9773-11579_t
MWDPNIVSLLGLYAFCSSAMVNKTAITKVPMPSLLLFIQYSGIAAVKLIPDLHTGMSYFRVSLAFLVSVFPLRGAMLRLRLYTGVYRRYTSLGLSPTSTYRTLESAAGYIPAFSGAVTAVIIECDVTVLTAESDGESDAAVTITDSVATTC